MIPFPKERFQISSETYVFERYDNNPRMHIAIKTIQTKQQNIRRINLINSIATNINSPMIIHCAQY